MLVKLNGTYMPIDNALDWLSAGTPIEDLVDEGEDDILADFLEQDDTPALDEVQPGANVILFPQAGRS